MDIVRRKLMLVTILGLKGLSNYFVLVIKLHLYLVISSTSAVGFGG